MADFLAEIGIHLDGNQRQQQEPRQLNGQTSEIVKRLLNAWRTEVNAPEILIYDEDLVDKIKTYLKDQQQAIDELFLELDDPDEQEKRHFTSTLYLMEYERIKYSLTRYLRARILKIEDSLDYILANPDMRDRLSYAEKQFATSLNSLNNAHFEDHINSRLPETSQYHKAADDRVKHARPQMSEFVFVLAIVDVDLVINDTNGDTLPMGEVWVARYSRVHREVLNGNVILL